MPTAKLLNEPLEIGRRIAAACAYSGKGQKEIAQELDRTDKTLRSYIKGNLGDYSTPDLRLSLIRRIEEITGCPPEIFGLSEPARDEGIQELRRAIAALATLATTPDLGSAARQLLEGELAAARQWSTNIPPIEEPGSGAENA